MMFLSPVKNPEKTTVLFFPFAGGTGEYYHNWLPHLHASLEGLYVRLPGRGMYFHEPAYRQLDRLVNDLCQEIIQLESRDIVLFGHSMGALIAFECARHLYFDHQMLTKHLFVSGHRAPRQPHTRKPLHQLNHLDLFNEMVLMGGVDENLTIGDIMPFFPALYSDFTLCETYQYQKKSPLPIPFSLLYGRSDHYINPETLNWWQHETTLPISETAYEGDHFYLNHQHQKVIQLINNQLVGDNHATNCQSNE